jgi:hypothetical protein
VEWCFFSKSLYNTGSLGTELRGFFSLKAWQIFLALFWWIFDQRIAGFVFGNQISVYWINSDLSKSRQTISKCRFKHETLKNLCSTLILKMNSESYLWRGQIYITVIFFPAFNIRNAIQMDIALAKITNDRRGNCEDYFSKDVQNLLVFSLKFIKNLILKYYNLKPKNNSKIIQRTDRSNIWFYGSSKICPARETVLNQKCIGCEMYKFSRTYCMRNIIFLNLTSAAYKKQPTETVKSPKVSLLLCVRSTIEKQ